MLEYCKHPAERLQKRSRVLKNGNVTVVMQCLECGGQSGGPISKRGEIVCKLPKFDEAIKTNYDEARNKEWKEEFAADQQRESDKWRIVYETYLKSEHWKAIRRLVMLRDPVCLVCFNRPSTDAHHVSYHSLNKFGYSFPVECAGVCRECHEKRIHQKVFDGG